jgi:hypothetical protein
MTSLDEFKKFYETRVGKFISNTGKDNATEELMFMAWQASEARFTMQKIVHNEYLDIHQTIYIKEE